MKKVLFPALVVFTLLASGFTTISSIRWKIAEGYAIKFSGKDADGHFKTFTGDIVFDEKNLAASKFSVSLDVASISTGNGMKNKHAKSDKWFNAKQFPTIQFVSEKFSKTAGGYTVEGTLEMHGVKKKVNIPFTFANNTFKGNFAVNRLDYGVGTMEGMSKKVSNEIKLDITVPVTPN
ncbi:MAG TPA: YceI family protein [Saprospiraceae bacterium]|nr:YceI family protein [Saprospiraceae bacterium]